MQSLSPQFINDANGKPSLVVLPIKLYEQLLEELDDMEDVRLYDQAKLEDDGTRTSLEDYIKMREGRNG